MHVTFAWACLVCYFTMWKLNIKCVHTDFIILHLFVATNLTFFSTSTLTLLHVGKFLDYLYLRILTDFMHDFILLHDVTKLTPVDLIVTHDCTPTWCSELKLTHDELILLTHDELILLHDVIQEAYTMNLYSCIVFEFTLNTHTCCINNLHYMPILWNAVKIFPRGVVPIHDVIILPLDVLILLHYTRSLLPCMMTGMM